MWLIRLISVAMVFLALGLGPANAHWSVAPGSSGASVAAATEAFPAAGHHDDDTDVPCPSRHASFSKCHVSSSSPALLASGGASELIQQGHTAYQVAGDMIPNGLEVAPPFHPPKRTAV
ncbi:hypothetical protein [Desertibaculum subflavum]|uniref:hypothetical protein n=1 Tax=Desertibaculum subflavum TaxID=2268458 RepID=UPI000E6715EC